MSVLATNMSRHLTPQTSTASNRVSSDARPSKSAAHVRKSPPPPSPDGWTAFVSATTTNTSTNSASNLSHAFVFASSRTVRSLHNRRSTYDDIGSLLAAGLTESIPLVQTRSSSSTTSSSTRPRHSKKPSLSSAQLARHSSGATDARCIISPSMRAAGFVPLYNSPKIDRVLPPCLAACGVPTPMYPPCFPPIVFVSHASDGSPPAWIYQESPFFGPLCETQTVAMAEALELEKAIVLGMASREQGRSTRTEGVWSDGGFVAGKGQGRRHRRGCECDERSSIGQERVIRRHGNMSPARSTSPLAPKSVQPPSRRGGEERSRRGVNDRSRSTKEKALGGLHLSTFPNTLDDPLEPLLNRMGGSGSLPKDNILPRRRIRREYPCQIEHTSTKTENHTFTALSGPLLDHERNRGHGRRRNQWTSTRSLSVDSLSSVASDTGTMTDSLVEEPLKTQESSHHDHVLHAHFYAQEKLT